MLQVIAAHPYTGEDEDELSFDKGEIIHVIPYDNPDDEVCVLMLIFRLKFWTLPLERSLQLSLWLVYDYNYYYTKFGSEGWLFLDNHNSGAGGAYDIHK